jgi:SAM-dependent methyltransferase
MKPRAADASSICPLCHAPHSGSSITTASGKYHHCRSCDLVFQTAGQLPDRQTEFAHYRSHNNRIEDPEYRRFLSQLAEPLMAQLPGGARGLDFGAGPAPALATMLDEAGFPTAIYDPFFAPDRQPLDQTYDFITCTETAEHFHQPRREFELIDRLLKPGGWLGLMTELQPVIDLFPDWWYHSDLTHVSFYSTDTLRWLSRHFGWRIAQLQERVVLLQKTS